MVSQEGLEQFKQIYKEEYGIELDPNALNITANNFFNLWKTIYKPSEPININLNQNHEAKISIKKAKE